MPGFRSWLDHWWYPFADLPFDKRFCGAPATILASAHSHGARATDKPTRAGTALARRSALSRSRRPEAAFRLCGDHLTGRIGIGWGNTDDATGPEHASPWRVHHP
jgi:hypothetical protein